MIGQLHFQSKTTIAGFAWLSTQQENHHVPSTTALSKRNLKQFETGLPRVLQARHGS